MLARLVEVAGRRLVGHRCSHDADPRLLPAAGHGGRILGAHPAEASAEACCASKECVAGLLSGKLLIALPSITTSRTDSLHSCMSTACGATCLSERLLKGSTVCTPRAEVDIPAPTPKAELEAILTNLAAHKAEWAALPLPEKAEMFRACMQCTIEVRRRLLPCSRS